jgi:CheY-like chemotaxis protein
MEKRGPILLIDDDADECELVTDAFAMEGIENEIKWFSDGREAYHYLETTTDKPFLILSDINLPGMNGLVLRRQIVENENLRRKSIPFVFFSTSATRQAVSEAFELHVQGFFEKGKSMAEIRSMLRCLYEYWQHCKHPNN